MPTEPTRPTASDVKSNIAIPESSRTPDGPTSRAPRFSDLTPDEKEQLRWLQEEYIEDRKAYRRKKEALAKIRTKIQESIDPDHFVYTMDQESTYDIMVKLKNRFKPTDLARKKDLKREWLALSKTGKTTDVDQWLQNWETKYDECRKLNIAEVQDDNAVHTFLAAVGTISKPFQHTIDVSIAYGKTPEFKELLQVYRNWRRNTQANTETPRPQAGAFPTVTPTLNGQTKDGETKPPKPCLCQEIHRWETCPYMFSWNRAPDWKGDKKVQEKVDTQMKTNGMKRHVQRITDKHNTSIRASSTDFSTVNQADTAPAVLMAHVHNMTVMNNSGLSSNGQDMDTDYPLLNSYILDSGATHHVCNDRSRFSDFRPASDEETLTSGNGKVKVGGYGTIWVRATCPGYPNGRLIHLRNTIYIPSFSTNVVSFNSFFNNDIHWDTAKQRLTYHGEIYCLVEQKHLQWVLEYHEKENDVGEVFVAHSSRKPKPAVKWSMEQAHQRLGHLYPEAVSHLPEACKDVESLTGEHQDPCQICRECDAKKVQRFDSPNLA